MTCRSERVSRMRQYLPATSVSLIGLIIVGAMIWDIYNAEPETIRWLGASVYSKIQFQDGAKVPQIMVGEEIAIGLRSDGVVVWTTIKPREAEPSLEELIDNETD